MKVFPSEVLIMLQSRLISYSYLLRFELETVFAFTSAGHDIEHDGITYQADGTFQGLDSLSRHAEMRVAEVKFGFSMANQAVMSVILGSNVMKRRITIERAYLNRETGEVMFVEQVWSGTVVGKSDDDGNSQIQLTAASRWSQFERTNTWRTTPHSHKKRYSDDECFKYAAKASETIYWAGTAGG
ncbi:DUF2163 domain-containing protein [Vibrio ziniensis]|uniref:DUF2163 domain-containing protein n=1 Tax=Vibrio ziniensis TaxID=2711221 RepID=A0A6G7CH91_9VIBR|nr:DUF2163 domain-containing protein [Vibrio ziniensis]QIH41459.1 DUF2163 domain-containing protein [Vibrio ziniensis]